MVLPPTEMVEVKPWSVSLMMISRKRLKRTGERRQPWRTPTVARDWLKSKGVSGLTDRSRKVYWFKFIDKIQTSFFYEIIMSAVDFSRVDMIISSSLTY